MSAARHAAALGCATLALTAGAATGAAARSADLEPTALVSAGPHDQADRASASALSADGRYVAFQGELDGLRGVFRRDRQTGAADLVAGAGAYLDPSDPAAAAADASAPSISADGRWVSFTTTAPLDAGDDANGAPDVYVRDMDAPPGADILASAVDGGATALAGGARAAGRVALSADGDRVAFVTLGAGALTPGGASAPAGQVVVRDLAVRTTTLVSSTRDPATGAMTGAPVPGGAVVATAPGGSAEGSNTVPGAALSADGTTVAWLGTHIADQAPTLSDEATATDAAGYSEPLWRRIADGPSAPTRRVVGGGDPAAPGCPPGGTLADAACDGPFPGLMHTYDRTDDAAQSGWLTVLGLDGVPQLSADGRTVALIGTPDQAANVFVVDMRDGLTRTQAVRPLTREIPTGIDPLQINVGANIALAGDIYDVGLSADGRRIAFATARQRFPLAPPNLVGTVPAALGLAELYRIDLDAQTLERITQPDDGGPSAGASAPAAGSGGGASSPSFSADGHTLAFTSDAANLVAGDGNDASDAFVVADHAFPDAPGVVRISAPPAPPTFTPAWRMAARTLTRPDGTVALDVTAPGAGTLRATATATVTVRRVARVTVHGRRVRRVTTRLATRTVATLTRRVPGGTVTLPLRLATAYAALAHGAHPLAAKLAVRLTAAAHPALADALAASFHRRRLTVTARSAPDGSVRLAVTAPGAGRLTVSARGRGRGGALATAHAATAASGRPAAAVLLVPTAAVRALARRRAGLAATATVAFTGAGGAQRATVPVRFHAVTR